VEVVSVRKVLLVLASVPLVALPLVTAPAALAHAARSDGESHCAVPKVDPQYDVDLLTVHVSLPASGCAAREHRMFDLAMTVTRMDNNGSHDTLDSGTTCGPFRSAGDVEPGDPTPQYSCDYAMGVDHPKVEAAQYDIDLTYPDADGQRTTTHTLFCRSDADQAAWEDLGPSAELHDS
jgi:hypothetical protein